MYRKMILFSVGFGIDKVVEGRYILASIKRFLAISNGKDKYRHREDRKLKCR